MRDLTTSGWSRWRPENLMYCLRVPLNLAAAEFDAAAAACVAAKARVQWLQNSSGSNRKSLKIT